VRCNLVNAGGLEPEVLLRWQPVMQQLGWHIAFQIAAGETADLRAFLEPFTVPIVIDHMGRPKPGRVDPSEPGLNHLVELIKAGGCFVKLSAPYRLSNALPPWPDVTPLARALIAANPAGCIWATDWPHTQHPDAVREDDLLAALNLWCPDDRIRKAILETTPAALYTHCT
jgi:predicted TIM-barrel fold metal-dependent hydrolase